MMIILRSVIFAIKIFFLVQFLYRNIIVEQITLENNNNHTSEDIFRRINKPPGQLSEIFTGRKRLPPEIPTGSSFLPPEILSGSHFLPSEIPTGSPFLPPEILTGSPSFVFLRIFNLKGVI